MISIRKAGLKDISLIVNIWDEFMKNHDQIVLKKNKKIKPYNDRLKNSPANYKKFVQKNLKSGKGSVFIAEVDGKVAGYTLISIKDNIPIFKLKRFGYFSDLYVKEQFRKLKISSKLKDEAIKWFKQKRITYISIGLYSDNKFAHSVYKKWGFMDYHIDMRKKI